MAVGRSEQGRKSRQKILNFMHKAGRAVSCAEICTALKQTRYQIVARLGQMRQVEEVQATEVVVNRRLLILYAPLVKTTMACLPPPSERPKVSECSRAAGEAIPGETYKGDVTTYTKRGLKHMGLERDHPAANHGGQGGVRAFRGIPSTLG